MGMLKVWDGATWQYVQGTQGPAGPTGPTGLTGATGPTGPNTLTGLTDTDISTPTNGDLLKYNGSFWINDKTINNLIVNYSTITTSGGVSILDNTSTFYQFATGSSNHTYTLPDTATLTLGQGFEIHNKTTAGNITIQTNTSAVIVTIEPGKVARLICISIISNATTAWHLHYSGSRDYTGTGSLVFGTSPAITTSLTTVSGSFDLINTTASTVNFAGAATTLAIGNTATGAQTLNLGTASTGASTYNLGTGATAASTTKTINLGTGGAASSTTNINIGSSNGGTTTINSGTLVGAATTQNVFNTVATTVNAFGAATAVTLGNSTAATLTVNPGTLVGANTTQNIFNTTATTVNFAGAATTLAIGGSSGTLTIGNATITATNATALNINGVSPSIVTSSTGTASVFNTNALTGNLFGAATTIAIGATTGTTTINNGLVLKQVLETTTIDTSTALSATRTQIDTLTSSIYYFSGTPSVDFTLNIRGNSTVTDLNTIMATGQTLSVTIIVDKAANTKKLSVIEINQVSQTINWFGGSAPTTGNALDIYSITILKTGASTYKVFASQSKFA